MLLLVNQVVAQLRAARPQVLLVQRAVQVPRLRVGQLQDPLQPVVTQQVAAQVRRPHLQMVAQPQVLLMQQVEWPVVVPLRLLLELLLHQWSVQLKERAAHRKVRPLQLQLQTQLAEDNSSNKHSSSRVRLQGGHVPPGQLRLLLLRL